MSAFTEVLINNDPDEGAATALLRPSGARIWAVPNETQDAFRRRARLIANQDGANLLIFCNASAAHGDSRP
jgi:hypothetical protein